LNKDFPYIINKEGQAIYFGKIISEEQINVFFEELINKIDWKNEVVVMFGNEITTKRKVAFYSDPNIQYRYSQRTKKGLEWISILLQIKSIVESYTQTQYNACLLNLYHNGNEAMGWHSDNEVEIMPNSSIASISLGAERKFSFKNKTTKETNTILLENGSLLEMKGELQNHWLHSLPKSTKIIMPRINLTFRQMIIK
jgi:alkylated DNA repair dioxygenase AlkB